MVAVPAVQIIEQRWASTTVLRLVGPVAEAGPMVGLARQLLAARVAGGHVVVDLDGLEVRDPGALCAFLARLSASAGGVPIPTVASDPGLRRLLRACGSGAAGLACFASLADAADVARPTGVPA